MFKIFLALVSLVTLSSCVHSPNYTFHEEYKETREWNTEKGGFSDIQTVSYHGKW